MGTGYTRNDTTNNIADGNVINAADLDGEFDAIVTALGTGGHTHDGTAAEGGPVTVVGPAQDVVVSASIVSPKTDNTLDIGTSTLEFKDLYLDGTAHIDTLDVDENANIDGNLAIGGNLSVAGTTSFSGGTLNLGDGAGDSVVFGADVNSSIIPNTDSTFDLGSTTQEWRDLFLDGTAHIDTLDVDVNATVAGTLGVTGIATFTDDIIIGDGKTIGSASDVDAITIAANGQLTLTQTLIGTALDISGDIDVDGTTNLDVVDIDGAVDMATTLQVDGVATFTARDIHSGGITIANAGQIGSVGDPDAIAIASDGVVTLTQKLVGTELDISGNIDVDGITNLDVVDIDGAVDMASTLTVAGVLTGASLDISGDIDVDGTSNLDIVDIDGAVNMATTALVTGVLTTTATQVATGGITSGSNIVSDTDSTDDLGTTSVRWANLFVDGITATDQITATGFTGTLDGILGSGAAATASVTTLDTSGAVNLNLATDSTSSTSGALIVDGGVGIAKKLFVGTTLGVTGVVTANAGVVVDEMTLDADTLTATDDFILDVAGNIEINADGGTITFKDDGATLGTVTSAGFSGLSATVAVSDSNANTNFPIVFHDESNALLDDTGALRYNPSTGQLLVPNLTVAGTTTTVDTVTMEAANAIIFEGATADAHETTLTIVDPTADRTVNIPNQSGTIPLLAAASNTAVTSTPEELNALDGITAVVGELNALDLGSTAVGTAIASKAVILDSNKDYTGIRNLTITGELDAATLDISGAIDVAGTSNLDIVDIDGAVDMAQTLQVDGIATFSAVPVANAGLSVKNGSTSGGFIQFFESGGTSNLKVIAPALAADATLTLPAVAGTIATVAAAIDEATALAIALG